MNRRILLLVINFFVGFIGFVVFFNTLWISSQAHADCDPLRQCQPEYPLEKTDSILVTNNSDSGDGSLRSAVDSANANPGLDIIQFSPDVSGIITLTSGPIIIGDDLLITGPDRSVLSVHGGADNRVVTIAADTAVTITDLTLKGGGAFVGWGGAIYGSNNNDLTLLDSQIVGSIAETGGAIYSTGKLLISNTIFANNTGDWGGSIYLGEGGKAMIVNSLFTDNHASSGGAGLFGNRSIITVTATTFTNNNGSAVSNIYGTITLNESIIRNNLRTSGAGLYSINGNYVVNNSTLAQNTAGLFGGGIYMQGGTLVINGSTLRDNRANAGGAIYTTGDVVVTMTNATVSANGESAMSAIDQNGGVTKIYNSSIADNFAPGEQGHSIWLKSGDLTIANSIVTGGGLSNCYISGGNFIGMGVNMDDDATCAGFVTADPLLTPLDNYGGASETYALLPGSPAIDAGDITVCSSTPVNHVDQRGTSRDQGSACDIGAFESRGFILEGVTGASQTSLINTVYPEPLSVVVQSVDGAPVEGGTAVFSAPLSGPSLTFAPSVTVPIGSVGTANLIVQANEHAGAFTATMTAKGNFGEPVIFNLTNLETIFLPFITN